MINEKNLELKNPFTKIGARVLLELLQLFKYSQSILMILSVGFSVMILLLSFIYIFIEPVVKVAEFFFRLFNVKDGVYSFNNIGKTSILYIYGMISLLAYLVGRLSERLFKFKWNFSAKKKLFGIFVLVTFSYAMAYFIFFNSQTASILVLTVFWLATMMFTLYSFFISWLVKTASGPIENFLE